MTDWHHLSTSAAEARLRVTPASGLGEDDACERLARHGPNRIAQPPGRSAWKRLADQLAQPLVVVLVVAGGVTLFLREWADAAVVLGVVALNAAIGYWQEAKAESALAALSATLATPAVVRRDGHRRAIDAALLVPGDVVLLAAGDRVPADLRLIKCAALTTNESSLTGESLPVAKHAGTLPADTGLAERINLAYAGTSVLTGKGTGLVIATGAATETGRIAGLIAAAPELATPLTRRMATFSRWLLWVIGALAGLTFVIGMARGETVFEMFMASVALAVGAIPEGLPAAVTVTLAIGVSRMARRRAIVRRLPAVEALGSTTVICSDKTGTLTENAMTVRAYWCGGESFALEGHGYGPAGGILRGGRPAAVDAALRECLVAGTLCNDASLGQGRPPWAITGDPTEAALLVATRKGDLDEATVRGLFPRLDELPFDAERRWMATLHLGEGGPVIYAKGAVEGVLARCTSALDRAGAHAPLDPPTVEAAAHALAAQGLRVLALARSHPGATVQTLDAELGGLTFLGLVGMIDPPRPAAPAAVKACQAAGVRVKMITGDHAATAAAIADRLGIGTGRVLTGRDLAALDDAALTREAAEVDIFARIEPEQKLRLVKALQMRGEVVAMTGDGVNDAPALKQADIGIAMGLGGTEVAKEAAAMVLTDDNFASIAAAVEEGRGVWDNLVKFITWTLPTNFGEGLVIVAAILFGATLPITPLQILWINMTTAVFLGLTLAFEPIEHGIMHRPPRRPDAPILGVALTGRILLVSLLLLAGAFGLFLHALDAGRNLAEARTLAVNVFVAVEAAYLFNCRSLTRGLRLRGLFANPWLWAGLGLTGILQGLMTYWPPLQSMFQTAAIGPADWLRIGAWAVCAVLAVELEKALVALWRRKQ